MRGITLDCTARQKVNFDVIRALVYLRAECQVTGHVSVDIPFRITRNTRTKEVETKRMKRTIALFTINVLLWTITKHYLMDIEYEIINLMDIEYEIIM